MARRRAHGSPDGIDRNVARPPSDETPPFGSPGTLTDAEYRALAAFLRQVTLGP